VGERGWGGKGGVWDGVGGRGRIGLRSRAGRWTRRLSRGKDGGQGV